jgi:hypothetical protein
MKGSRWCWCEIIGSNCGALTFALPHCPCMGRIGDPIIPRLTHSPLLNRDNFVAVACEGLRARDRRGPHGVDRRSCHHDASVRYRSALRDPAWLGAGVGGGRRLKAPWMASRGVSASVNLIPLFQNSELFRYGKNFGL